MISRNTAAPLIQHKGVRQFVKFGIVGVSSTFINFLTFNLLYHKAGCTLLIALSIAFLLSVCNGFFWNRRWTFKDARQSSTRSQSFKFLLVNLVGFILDTTIVVLIVAHATSNGHGFFGDPHQFGNVAWAILSGEGKKQYGFWLTNGALAAATCVVVFWNYFANRLWTFKQ